MKGLCKNFFTFLFLILCFLTRSNLAPKILFPDLEAASMIDYCYVPTSISEAVKPFVLIVMDFSGSMQFPAYVPCSFIGYTGQKAADCQENWANYDQNLIYYGYFDPLKCYEYTGANFQEKNCNCADRVGSTTCISGNLLNWITTTRVDIARWVLTGGRSSSSGGNTFLESTGAKYTIRDGNLKCEFKITTIGPDIRKLTISNYNGTCPIILVDASIKIRASDPNAIKGIIHDFCDTSDLNGQINEKCKVIFGFMVFAGDDRYGEMKVGKQATISNLISAINNELPYWGTPTGEALWEAYDFFKQRNDHSYEANSAYLGRGNANQDPYYDGSGQRTLPVPCRRGFILLLTDGAWNGAIDPVKPAREMLINDLREDLPGKQNVWTYVVYAFGDLESRTRLQGRQASITTAIFGGFADKDNNLWPYPFNNYPTDSRNVNYPLSQCNLQGNWDQLCREWDTAEGSSKDGLPYNFFEADDAGSLRSALLNALYDILRRASSGATVATLSQRISTGALILQPYFYSRYQAGEVELSWIGFLKALWVDAMGKIREETVADKILNLLQDLWVQFVSLAGETKIYTLTNETTCAFQTKPTIESLVPLFEAGCKLAQTPTDNRKVYVNANGTLTLLKNVQANFLSQMWTNVVGQSINATCIVNYLLGEDNPCPTDPLTSSYTNRPRTADLTNLCGISGSGTWKLGDIYHSTPTIISFSPLNNYHIRYNDLSYLEYINSDAYRRRATFAFVGANDGMLHAFRLGWLSSYQPPEKPLKLTDAFNSETTDLLGKEEWAFIPQNALPYLVWLGHKDYCHIPTVDYRVSVFDAKIDGQWRTLLLGMMGFGGKVINAANCPEGKCASSLFLLDLTDWLEGRSNSPQLLWETKLADQTLTLSYPQIVKLSRGSDWSQVYVVLGSGPKEITGIRSPYFISFPNSPILYFFDLRTGIPAIELAVNAPNQAIGSLRVMDYNNDYVDDVIYFGTYNETSGEFFRVRLTDNNFNPKDLNNIIVEKVFSNFPSRPVFASPQVTLDNMKNIWVVFGTGHYLTKNYPSTNYFIAFIDECFQSNCTIDFSNLSDRTNFCNNTFNYNATILYNSSETTCVCGEDSCSATPEVMLYQYLYPFSSNGWYHQLSNSEQMYSSSFIYQFMVNALSFRPIEDICSAGGETWYWMVCLVEGCPCYNLRGETQPVVSTKLAFGSPPVGQPFQPLKTEKGLAIFTQTSAGGIIQTPNPQRSALRGRFILWIEK